MNYEEAMKLVMAARPRTVGMTILLIEDGFAIDPTDDCDDLKRQALEVAEALAAEVDRLRAFRTAVAVAAGLAEEIDDEALVYGAVERPLCVLRKVARTADLTDVPLIVAPWAPENPPQTHIPEMEFLREENEVSIGAAQYLAAMVADPDGGLADAVWRALGDGARERVETLLKAARDAVGGEK